MPAARGRMASDLARWVALIGVCSGLVESAALCARVAECDEVEGVGCGVTSSPPGLRLVRAR